jgi:hypothetical protein
LHRCHAFEHTLGDDDAALVLEALVMAAFLKSTLGAKTKVDYKNAAISRASIILKLLLLRMSDSPAASPSWAVFNM